MLLHTAWRADPGLLTACAAAALGYVVLSLAYPLGFRAIINGATEHRAGVVVLGVIITVVALPGSWLLRLIGATLGSKLTDQASLRLGLLIGLLANAAACSWSISSGRTTWPRSTRCGNAAGPWPPRRTSAWG